MLRCLNWLCHVILDILAAPWKEDDIFGFFGVRHSNRERKKYNINKGLYGPWVVVARRKNGTKLQRSGGSFFDQGNGFASKSNGNHEAAKRNWISEERN